MHPLRYPIIADENIHIETVYRFREWGLQMDSIRERNLRGSTDEQIVALAEAEGKVILTHDSDFGRIIYASQSIKTGIIFIRPGHIDYTLVIQTVEAILATDLNASIPFMLVAERTGNDIKIRLRIL
jgi:predicted nuclease of predicted toxin-antitoxin system